ncbi:DUF1315 family protein [Vibrio breoganii]|uniref:DUF1315 family protein n=1 Tax=Vibrio breoganii TaxID=553239 RepID=A0AAP8SVF4_9VIBR|nr:DUF1315 family protein [Vibrio breoganii]NMO72738.1 DUF1315 family protein [Vibrio breoganii]NMR69135.1 DUF1315 family protein [Vibrio breoganii]OCH73645.1 hypothetical protein A6D95_03605 [Vibrio breoganii]OED97805.1 hypothetical protein A1QG_09565 [Vibrio breoganii ZF-29]PMF83305.1 hypothetical protein BCV08_01800 [Vibrio breoganii]
MSQTKPDLEQMVAAITPEAYQRLCFAVETGRWPEGTALSEEQRAYCQQAVMLYQSKNNTEAQHMTVAAGGEISFKSKSELKRQFNNEETITKVKVD